ncbi:MAG: hypothetical protein Q4D95_05265 [Peptoniphilus sp.]|nr:hypothetical protein [Peptoniphilus sp.]
MVKWFNLFGRQYLGFWSLGLMLFVLQEMPYMIMPLIKIKSNPIMNMKETSPLLNFFEKFLGISCVLVMCFIVKEDLPLFAMGRGVHRAGFVMAVLFLWAYYLGWLLYFRGYQRLWVMLGLLVAMPPLYYASIGLWRENPLLFILGIIFGIVHLLHVHGNLKDF